MEFIEIIFPIMFFIAVFFVVIFNVAKAAGKNNAKNTQKRPYTSNTTNKSGFVNKNPYAGNAVVKSAVFQSGERKAIKSTMIDRLTDHSHPSDTGKVEKVDEYYGSLGKINDEGCQEHLGVRFVDAIPLTEDNQIDYDDVARMIIIGEAISHPKCRKRH